MQTPGNDAQLRSERLDRLVTLLRSKLAANQHATLEGFVRR